jgi:hypothetical protein
MEIVTNIMYIYIYIYIYIPVRTHIDIVMAMYTQLYITIH